jgi:hypothetical protein
MIKYENVVIKQVQLDDIKWFVHMSLWIHLVICVIMQIWPIRRKQSILFII